MIKLFLELLISILDKFDKDREKRQREFKRRREEFDREWNKWHSPRKIKINLSDKYR